MTVITITKLVEVATAVSYCCDRCKKTTPCDDHYSDDYIHITHLGGYGSVWPGDSVEIDFHLCSKCTKKLFSSFVTPKPTY